MAERHAGRTLRETVRVVASRFVGMAVIFIVVVGATAAATYFAPASYRCEVRLLAKPSEMFNPLETRAGTRDEVSLFVVTQREIILSDHVLALALMRLEGLQIDRKKLDQQIAQWIGRSHKKLAQAYKRVKVIMPGGAGAAFTQTFKIRVDWPEKRPEAFRRAVASRKAAAEQVYEMTGSIVEEYLNRYKDLESRRTRAATKFLTDKSLAAARASLDEAIQAQETFITQEVKGDLPQVVQMLNRGSGAEMGPAKLRTRSQEEMNTIDGRLAELGAIQVAIAAEVGKADVSAMVVPDMVVSANDAVSAILDKIVELKLELMELKSRYTDKYQEVRDLRTELHSVQTELREELKKHKDALEQEISVLKSRHDKIKANAERDRKRVEVLAAKVAKYDQLQREVAGAQEIYDRERQRVASAFTAEKLAENPILVSILDEPRRPDPQKPRWPIWWLNILLGVGAGLVLALIYAFTSDHFDHTIKSIDEAERYLGVPVLASLPKLGRRIIRRA